MTAPPYRGQVFWAGTPWGEKPWLIVGNNRLNARLSDVIAVRMTTTVRFAHLPEVVALDPATDQLSGVVHCGTITQVRKDDLIRPAGALSPATMAKIDIALAHALALR